jgi:hypothetical protein
MGSGKSDIRMLDFFAPPYLTGLDWIDRRMDYSKDSGFLRKLSMNIRCPIQVSWV